MVHSTRLAESGGFQNWKPLKRMWGPQNAWSQFAMFPPISPKHIISHILNLRKCAPILVLQFLSRAHAPWLRNNDSLQNKDDKVACLRSRSASTTHFGTDVIKQGVSRKQKKREGGATVFHKLGKGQNNITAAQEFLRLLSVGLNPFPFLDLRATHFINGRLSGWQEPVPPARDF